MESEIFMIIENGKVTELVSRGIDVKVIVINLDNRKKGDEPVIDFFTFQPKENNFSRN